MENTTPPTSLHWAIEDLKQITPPLLPKDYKREVVCMQFGQTTLGIKVKWELSPILSLEAMEEEDWEQEKIKQEE